MLACRSALRKNPSCSFYQKMLNSPKITKKRQKAPKKRQKALDTPYTWKNKSNVEGILFLYRKMPQIEKELVLACRLAVKNR